MKHLTALTNSCPELSSWAEVRGLFALEGFLSFLERPERQLVWQKNCVAASGCCGRHLNRFKKTQLPDDYLGDSLQVLLPDIPQYLWD